MTFAPLHQRTTPDAVLDALRTAILDGTLAPGSQLREAHIAADMGISRAPVREALRKLEEEDLAVKLPFRGSFVAEVGPEIVEEIASLRRLLEPFAVERALPYLRGPGSARLVAASEQITTSATDGHISETVDAHLAFHRLFYEAAEHKILLNLWNGWQSQLKLFLAADFRSFDDPMAVATNHAELLGVLQSADIEEIREAVAAHVHGADAVATEEPTAG